MWPAQHREPQYIKDSQSNNMSHQLISRTSSTTLVLLIRLIETLTLSDKTSLHI